VSIDGCAPVPLIARNPLVARLVVVEESITLQPRQQVDVVARTTVPCWKTPETTPTVDMVDSHRLRPGVYVGRTILHRKMRIPVVNTTSRPVKLREDTYFGTTSPVTIISDGKPNDAQAACRSVAQEQHV